MDGTSQTLRVCRRGHDYTPGRGCPTCDRRRARSRPGLPPRISDETAGRRAQKSVVSRFPVLDDLSSTVDRTGGHSAPSVSHLGTVGRRTKDELAAWAKRAHRPLAVIVAWDREDRTCAACNLIFESWDELVGHQCDGFKVHRPRPIPQSKSGAGR